MIKFPTRYEITKSAQERRCSEGEAGRDLTKQALSRHLSCANSLDEVKEVIRYLVDKL